MIHTVIDTVHEFLYTFSTITDLARAYQNWEELEDDKL